MLQHQVTRRALEVPNPLIHLETQTFVVDHEKKNTASALHTMSSWCRRVIIQFCVILSRVFNGAAVVYPELILASVVGSLCGSVGEQR